MIADGVVPSPLSVSQVDVSGGRRVAAKQSSVSSIATAAALPGKERARRDSQATAVLTEPFDALAVGDEVDIVGGKKKVKQSKHKSISSQTAPGIIDLKDINGPLSSSSKSKTKGGKGKGWRNTPLIEEIPAVSGKQQLRKQRGRRQQVEDANGWATEDATDIQDLGEFDFASNLSKFDKRQVFDDIRRDDTTADEERLVSFNRKPKPGTNGGRNLHWTENVLETPTAPVAEPWNSEAGETENEVRGEDHYSSGRGSRRAGSRRPLQQSSRKGSMLPNQLHVERTASPRPFATTKGIQSISPMNGSGSVSSTRASFRLQNNKPCHCVSPLQMVEIEQLCTSELGLTDDMLSENAGRSIAEAVFKTASEVRNVVVLVGNHKSGARAIAAARHLRNRRLRVTVVVLGGEREEELLSEVLRKQLSIYRKGQGYVDRWDEFQTKVSSSGGNSPQPDVVIDAILGVHVAFDELRTDDQATAFEMIRWASRTPNVISIDVPSGLSATTGLITEAEGQLLLMNASSVVALGSPKTGLLQAMTIDGAESQGWNVLVADMGISNSVWARHGTRRRGGVEFGGEWVVQVRFVVG